MGRRRRCARHNGSGHESGYDSRRTLEFPRAGPAPAVSLQGQRKTRPASIAWSTPADWPVRQGTVWSGLPVRVKPRRQPLPYERTLILQPQIKYRSFHRTAACRGRRLCGQRGLLRRHGKRLPNPSGPPQKRECPRAAASPPPGCPAVCSAGFSPFPSFLFCLAASVLQETGSSPHYKRKTPGGCIPVSAPPANESARRGRVRESFSMSATLSARSARTSPPTWKTTPEPLRAAAETGMHPGGGPPHRRGLAVRSAGFSPFFLACREAFSNTG